MAALTSLEQWIAQNEGLSLFPKADSYQTLQIGYGRNLSRTGISQEEALYLMRNDIARVKRSLETFYWYTQAPQCVQDALVNMGYNLGMHGLMGFKTMIACLEKKDYERAAEAAMSSLWARQVGKRAIEVTNKIKEGAHES